MKRIYLFAFFASCFFVAIASIYSVAQALEMPSGYKIPISVRVAAGLVKPFPVMAIGMAIDGIVAGIRSLNDDQPSLSIRLNPNYVPAAQTYEPGISFSALLRWRDSLGDSPLNFSSYNSSAAWGLNRRKELNPAYYDWSDPIFTIVSATSVTAKFNYKFNDVSGASQSSSQSSPQTGTYYCPTGYTLSTSTCNPTSAVQVARSDNHCDILRSPNGVFYVNPADPDCVTMPGQVVVSPKRIVVTDPATQQRGAIDLNPDGSTSIEHTQPNTDGTTTTTTVTTNTYTQGDTTYNPVVTNVTTTNNTTINESAEAMKVPTDYSKESTQKTVSDTLLDTKKILDDALTAKPENNISTAKNLVNADTSLEDTIASVTSQFDMSTAIDHSRDIGAGCPVPRSVPVLGSSFTINYAPFCDLAAKIAFLIMISASLISLRIIGGAL